MPIREKDHPMLPVSAPPAFLNWECVCETPCKTLEGAAVLAVSDPFSLEWKTIFILFLSEYLLRLREIVKLLMFLSS
ncbi:MAG TPA: hypothetical protein VI685_28555, partial [Candidatus Angelobacter sp.]